MAEETITLTYLDIKGMAEPIRLALFIAEIDFEDERISYEEVAKRRESGLLPHGQVPVLSAPGIPPFSQTMAILHWAGRQGTGSKSLWPATIQAECHHDMVEAAIGDILALLKPVWYGHILGRSPVTGKPLVPMSEEQKAETARALNEEVRHI